MKLFRKMRRQYACYWPPAAEDDGYGNPTYGQVKEIKVRWEDSTEQVLSSVGQLQAVKSKVYCGKDDGVVETGVLWLGKKAALTSETEPFANPKAGRIFRVDKLPDVKAKDTLVTAYL